VASDLPDARIVVSLAVFIATAQLLSAIRSSTSGLARPFLVSFLLVAIAIYIRLQLQETPIFQEIKAKGQMTRTPGKRPPQFQHQICRDRHHRADRARLVWYSGQFWALYFLQQVSKVDR